MTLPGRLRSILLPLALLTHSACLEDGASDETRLAPFPPPVQQGEARTSLEDFAGAEACASCHQDEYRAWARSTHGRAGGEPGPDVIIAPFDGRAMRFADAVVIPRVRSGSYEFVVQQDHFPELVYRVDGVIGGGHMLGGGTQGFISRMDDGTARFLPWDWSRAEGAWFCNTGSRLNRGWVIVTRDMRLADCGDWPPLRPIGTVDRFTNCQECHGSQIQTRLDPEARSYQTEYTTLQVNCESCHGPARRHVTWAQSGAPDGDIGLESLAYLDKDASLEVCFRCHALKDVIKEGYFPGESLEEHYALKFPVLGDQPYFADGRVRSFAYQANHLASACYLQGPMDCVSCHEPHGQGYWDTDKKPLGSPFDDGQCTSCHPSKLVDPEAHTFHPAGSPGSRCVACHMPYLQHPEVGPEVRFSRSDHTIAIPRPTFDADLGIAGACAQCHRDRTPVELQREARAWWGELRPHRPLVQGQVDELRARNVSEASALLIHPEEVDPLVQFQALSRLLTGYLNPDDDALPATVVDGLTALASSPDMDVRALALASLHWVRGDDPGVRRVLVDALEHAGDDQALRGRWALALGFLGDTNRDEGRTERAMAAYRKALEIRPGDPKILDAEGSLRNRTGEYLAAAALFRRSLDTDPLQPLGWVNLGMALSGAGDALGAAEAYDRALQLNPREAVALFNFGNLRQRAGDLPSAAEAYARAVAADPGMGPAYFELARVLILMDRPADALAPARRAVEFRPDHLPSRQMLQDLERTFGGQR
ncbi:MAG TPA: tetratricopeptide repeat protein [Longimicrobiales bacterium]|nr:tetratricopeptide repeat protein [Longimicrobiales bacterium]